MASLSVLSDLSVHLCLLLTFVSFVLSPLSDDRRLAQMTQLTAFVKPSRASFTHRKTRAVRVNALPMVAFSAVPRGPSSIPGLLRPPAPQSFVCWPARGTSEAPPCPQLPICCCHQCSLLLLSPEIWWENWTPPMARYWAMAMA